MDAMVAYLQVLGTAVERPKAAAVALAVEDANPLAGSAAAIAKGKDIYLQSCAACHGDALEGTIAPALADGEFLYQAPDAGDASYFRIIHGGTDAGTFDGRKAEGGMPPFGAELSKDDIWSVIAFIRQSQGR
jgi:mono/diheme cytochrome c family protein